MNTVVEQKCVNCGGRMHFEPSTGCLTCEFCGTEINISESGKQVEVSSKVEGFDFKQMSEKFAVPDAENLPVYICNSCGAELIAPAEEFSLNCPYCGNAVILSDKISGKLRPDGVIPFSIKPDVLPAAMKEYYKDKKLLPFNFFSKSTMGKVTGVYVPFWLFSGSASGRLTFTGEITKPAGRVGDYLVTNTDVYLVTRDVKVDFKDVPVDASGKIEDALMDSLEPFNMDGLKPFDISYLAGYTADRFDVAADDIAKRAEKRMCNTAAAAAANAISGYSNLKRTGSTIKADLDAKYVLFPVYLFSINHEGIDYKFAVNGQTGKVVGHVPTDKKVSLLYQLLRVGIVAGGLLLLRIILFLLMSR